MKLIGQYDSPFVRRVAVALRLYGMEYDHLPWSTFHDADRVAQYNPLRRVPTLVLDDGEALIESAAILDYLDGEVGPGRAMFPAGGPPRRHAVRRAALATGLCDKAVALIYERVFHPEPSPEIIVRCTTQIAAVLAALETERAAIPTPYWDTRIGHADIALGCAVSFVATAHPALLTAGQYPALQAHRTSCEATEAFAAITQAFLPPS